MKTSSIVITHRERQANLRWCLRSIAEAYSKTADYDLKVVVVENGSACFVLDCHEYPFDAVVIYDNHHMPIFNKSQLLNVGIEATDSDIITFLDADAIVGPQFFETYSHLDDPQLTLLCHRVRYLEKPPAWESDIPWLFSNYDKNLLATEIRGGHFYDCRGRDDILPVFGNSQCSIRRETLGKLRYNEHFVGAAYEDLWFLRELWRREGPNYRGFMPANPWQSMFHIRSRVDDMPGWRNTEIVHANRQLYEAT